MSGVNKAIITGRVGQDPKVTTFNGGGMAVEFSLATSDTWRDKQTGERKERTQWHRIKVMNEAQAKIAAEYVKRGSLVGIVGEIQYRDYEKDGTRHFITEIVVGPFRGELHLLGSKDDNAGGGERRDNSRHDDRRQDSGGNGRRDDQRNDRGYGQRQGGRDGGYGQQSGG